MCDFVGRAAADMFKKKCIMPHNFIIERSIYHSIYINII
jgi:hypothetical protein